MPEAKVSFHKFGEGFISDRDMNEIMAQPIPTMYVAYPEGACKDISGFEINAPMYCLKESTGAGLVYSLPAYSGNRIVAHKNWKVTNPANQEITTMVTASSNLLRYSEDFEITTAWTLTAGSATLTANSQVSPQGVRMGDRLTNINATTKLEQLFSLSRSGGTTVFSLYFKKTTANRIRLTLLDTAGSNTVTSNDSSGNWTRLSVLYGCPANTGTTVRIDFPDSTGSDTCDIWGAQAESGIVAAGYGYTFHYARPYYILQRPYWNGLSFVDDWQELTEMRSGAISSSVDTAFTITGLDGVNGYYNNWYAWDNTLTTPTGYITTYFNGGTCWIVGKKIAVDGHFVVMSKFPFFAETPYFQQGVLTESNISFVEVNNDLKISFGNTHRPLTVKYIDSTILGVLAGYDTLVPASDIYVGTGWYPFPELPTTLYDKINQVDSTDTSSDVENLTTTDYYEFKFSATIFTPTVASYKYAVQLSIAGFRADLYCGATLIHTGATSTVGYGLFTESLTAAEIAVITAISGGWSNLRVRIYPTGFIMCTWCNLMISGFAGTSATPYTKNDFSLTYSTHIGVQPPSENDPVLPSATLEESDGVGFGASVISLSQTTGGSLTLLGTYKIYVVGLIDANQRIPIWTGDITLTSSNNAINAIIPIVTAGFDWRLTALEVYIGTGSATPGDTSGYFFYCTVLMADIVNGVLSGSLTDNNWTITVLVTDMDSLQNTLLLNLGGCLDTIETRARYNTAFYLLGRMFIGQTNDANVNIVRYSNINGLTSEIDKFAYNSAGYGFFTFDSSMNQSIMGVCRTIENDLLIVQESDVSLFEVESGSSSAKRLRQMFTGIGSSNLRSLVISDYGNFWYDDNDVYWYRGGYSVPDKISKGKIRHWWREVLSPYISTSFAIFNRQVNEYWIFINNGTNWIVLRYSPEFNNWNIWTPGFTPIWVSDELDGTVTITKDTAICQFGGSDILTNPYMITHKRKLTPDTISAKQVTELYMTDYSSNNDITLSAIIDNETNPRTGNSPVFLSTKNTQRRSIRMGSSMNSVALQITANAGGGTQINEFGLIYQTRKDRTSERK